MWAQSQGSCSVVAISPAARHAGRDRRIVFVVAAATAVGTEIDRDRAVAIQAKIERRSGRGQKLHSISQNASNGFVMIYLTGKV